MNEKRTFRIFISSPGDVRPERLIAERVVQRLDREFSYHCRIEPVLWERKPLVATKHFQEDIPLPSSTDVVVVIIWSRLGTPLPSPKFLGAMTGNRVTGTEWEFEEAYKANKESGMPDLLVYRKTAPSLVTLRGDETEERRRQAQMVDAFVRQWFVDAETGSFKAASHAFEHPAELEEVLERHLRGKILELLGNVPELHGIRWHKGSPFRGLQSFEMEHAQVFFGRTRARHELRQTLTARLEAGCPFLLVMGASGSGKSSLVKAGLLPDLLLPGMLPGVGLVHYAIMRPSDRGASPFLALAVALLFARALPGLAAGPEELSALPPQELARRVAAELQASAQKAELAEPWQARLVLVIDQLEELFADTVLPAERSTFVAHLDALVRSGVLVVATMRSDFFDRLETLPQLAALSEGNGRVLLLPPDDAEIGQIIRQPAQEAGVTFEIRDGIPLDETLRMAAAAEPGVLPLLEFTLDQLWNRKNEKGQLTTAAYDELGGLKGAIGRRAEDIFLEQTPAVQAALPAVLFSLARAEQGEKGRILANTIPLARFADGTPERVLVSVLLAPEARLLVASEDGRLRVAHEALLSHWDRARDLVESYRADLQLREKLTGALNEWRKETGRKQDSLLLHAGLPLSQAQDLLARRRADLDAELIRFIAASTAYDQRRLRRLKIAAVAFAFLAIAAGIGAWFGFTGQAKAVKRERQALMNESRFLTKTALAIAQKGVQDTSSLVVEAALPSDLAHPDRPISSDALAALARLAEEDRLAGVLLGHKAPVDSAAFSPSGDRLVTTAEDGTARLWDVRSGAELAVLTGHTDWVVSAQFSFTGDRIVTASYDNTARVWDGRSGALITVLTGHTDRVLSAAFSPRGNKIVTTSFDGTARLWNAHTGVLVAVLAHKGPVLSAAFDPSGTRVVTASEDRTARVWDTSGGRQLVVLFGHRKFVKTAEFSPSGDRIVTASYDGTARIWDAASGARRAVLSGHGDSLNSASFNAAGDEVVTASCDKTARVWDARSGRQLALLAGHEDWVRSAAFSRSGDLVITSSYDTTARLWDVHTGAQLAVFAGHGGYVRSAVFSPSGDRAATVSSDTKTRLWDTRRSTQIAAFAGHSDMVRSAAFSPAGDRVVTASADKTARIWDVHSGAQQAVLAGHGNWVRSAAFSPTGDRIVTASGDNSARLWDARSGAQLAVLAGHTEPVLSADFSPSGDLIVTGSSDGTARLWDARSGKALRTLSNGKKGTVESVVFSPSGDRIAAASDDRTARIWDVQTGTQLAQLIGHDGPVYSIEFSPSGDLLVTASQDKTARLWDARTGAQRAVLLGHDKTVLCAKFSPSGDRIVTSSRDRTIRVWDTQNGAQLAVLSGHEAAVHSAVFNRTGDRLVSASEDKTARLWDVHLLTAGKQDLLDRLKITKLRHLTDTEREAYFISRPATAAKRSFTPGGAHDPAAHRTLAERCERSAGAPADLEKALFEHALAAQLYEAAGDPENAAFEMNRRGTLARNLNFEATVDIWRKVRSWKGK